MASPPICAGRWVGPAQCDLFWTVSAHDQDSVVRQVTTQVEEGSRFAGKIAAEISEVNSAAAGISESSSEVNQSSEKFSRLAQGLKKLVGRFRI